MLHRKEKCHLDNLNIIQYKIFFIYKVCMLNIKIHTCKFTNTSVHYSIKYYKTKLLNIVYTKIIKRQLLNEI